MPCILAIDQGTTSSRAFIVGHDGTILARAQREFPQHFPEPGWVEHDPRDLQRSAIEAARQVLSEVKERPSAVGITNQRETVVIWDRKSLEPVGPAIVWQDRRTTERCDRLRRDGLEALIRDRTGLVIDPYFSATKIEWLLARYGLAERASRGELAVGTVDSWLVACLTKGSAHVTDPTNASRTMLYGLGRGDWDDELLDVFGIPRVLLPSIVPSSGCLATTDPAVLGVSLPIAGIAGDQQAALFGQGCTTPGTAKNTYGTGAFLLVHAGEARPTPRPGLLATAACGPSGGLAFAVEGSVFIAGAAIQWLRDGLGLLATASESAAVASSLGDNGGVYFVPAFVGLGSPYWEPRARGMITGLTRGTSRGHLVRAALESMAFSSRDLLAEMTAGTDLELPSLRVDGGASANDWLMQFQADLLGVPVERPDCVESTVLGAAGLAGVGVGLWKGVNEFVATRRFTVFEPRIDPERRTDLLAGWARAVRAAIQWARSESGAGTP